MITKNKVKKLSNKCLDCEAFIQDHNTRCTPCHLKWRWKDVPIEETFFKFVAKTNTCWLWNGSKYRDGYGAFHIPKSTKMISCHRQSWMIHKGEIPEGMRVLHTCDRRNCCNPEHLFLGTMQDNTTDMTQKKRAKFFGKPQKLTPEDVKRIREVYSPGKYTLKMLAKEYNCHLGTIHDAIHRRWKHV